MWRSTVISAVVWVGGGNAAFAQTYLELGANIGQACLMGEASCADEVQTRGWQVGLWIDEKRAIRFRHLDAPRPDRIYDFGEYTARWSDQGRSLWLGEMTWHFGAPNVVRFFAGFSVGARRDRLKINCEPVACSDIPRTIVSISTRPERAKFTLGGVAGLSIHPIRRMVVMLQIGSHDFPGEHVGTFVFSAHAVYRHPFH